MIKRRQLRVALSDVVKIIDERILCVTKSCQRALRDGDHDALRSVNEAAYQLRLLRREFVFEGKDAAEKTN